jgi:hypothetical protein
VYAEVTGLAAHTTYTFCLVAIGHGSNTGQDGQFTSASVPPIVEGESFSQVGSDEAVLGAKVDMENSEGSYHFVYDAPGGELRSTPEVGVSPGANSVTAQIAALQPVTTYHFHIVVSNTKDEAAEGSESAFTTLPVGIQGLPDDRTFEMVTQIDREGAEVYFPTYAHSGFALNGEGYNTEHIMQVAAGGNAVVYQGEPTRNGKLESNGVGLGSAYLATRSPGGGWSDMSIQPPGRQAVEYHGFSTGMSAGVLTAPTEEIHQKYQLPGGNAPSVAPSDIYRHTFSEEGYATLFTAMPDGSSGFGGVYTDNRLGNADGEVLYAGSSADFEQLLFAANTALLEGEGALESELNKDVKQEMAEQQTGDDYLYNWSSGHLSLVDVSPDGKVAPDAIFGSPGALGTNVKGNPPDLSHVISTDGSRVFWTELQGHAPHNRENQAPKALYVRENPSAPQSPLNGQGECMDQLDACTVQIDKEVGGGARFWTADSNGSKAFFTKGALYEYEINPVVGQSGTLIDLTPGIEVAGVLGASESGDYVYYVTTANELYVLHENGGEWEAPVSITTLSAQDGDEVSPFIAVTEYEGEGYSGDWDADLGERTAEVTPDGQGLVFMSSESLKTQGFPNGYKNEGSEEVYVYNAAVNSLFCASCSQSEEPDSAGSAFLPISWSDTYIPTWISEDGDQVFFDSPQSLVPQDTNGRLDVYEWEREGTGSCTRGEGADGGCIYLLSGGVGDRPSYLLGASANGAGVFIITSANLTAEAGDEVYKLFDARVEGVKLLAPPACTGTGCQGAPAPPPTFATPSSVTYAGVGNFPAPVPAKMVVKAKAKPMTRAQKLAKALKACKAKPKRRRVSCEARARKRYGPKGKTKASSRSKRGRK